MKSYDVPLPNRPVEPQKKIQERFHIQYGGYGIKLSLLEVKLSILERSTYRYSDKELDDLVLEIDVDRDGDSEVVAVLGTRDNPRYEVEMELYRLQLKRYDEAQALRSKLFREEETAREREKRREFLLGIKKSHPDLFAEIAGMK